MSEATDALVEGEEVLQVLFPSTFTVDGRSDVFSGLLDTTSASKELTGSGMRGADSAVLGFLKSAGYTPEVGDEVTVAGVMWRVAVIRGGPVKWEVALVSDDE